MKKNENNFMESSKLKRGRLFNGIKNSLKNSSKKSFGKIGLFLIFGIIIWNLNLQVVFIVDKNEYIANIKFLNAANANGVMYYLQDGWNGVKYAVTDPLGYLASTAGVIVDSAATPFVWAFNWLLYGVLVILSKLLIISGALMDMALDPKLFDSLINDQSLYAMWAFVRDFLNIFFMLILLFSAFATIFQVEKYHLRKMIIMLVVMALLVNFSFPISRFVIDFSNSAMYFFVDQLVANSGASGDISKSALIANITKFGSLQKSGISGDLETTVLILGLIIFTFILFITMLAIALNLAIRLIAFMILIVFSPVGFAFAFFPGTKNIADDWWNYLFKYAIMGPVMTFFLLMAMVVFGNSSLNAPDLSKEDVFIPTVLNFIFIVSFLWIGLMAAQKFGGSGATAAMNFAKKTGGNIKSYGQKAAWGTVGMAGKGADSLFGNVPSGAWNATKNRFKQAGDNYKDRTEKRAAQMGGFIGVKDSMSKFERKNYEEDVKKMKNFTVEDLETKAKTGSIAAADELLNRKSLKQEIYQEAIKNSKDKKRSDDLTAKFKGANKESRIDIVTSIDANKKANDETEISKAMAIPANAGLSRDQIRIKILTDEIHSKIGDMNYNDFSKQNFSKIAGNISEKIASTDAMTKAEGNEIKKAIESAFVGLDSKARDEITKNVSKNQRVALRRIGIAV